MTKSRATSSFLLRACAALCLLLAYAFTVGAQNTSPQRGFNPGGSYAISDIETISTSGGNLGLSIPLGGLPAGRGGLKASLNLVYNSKLWDSYPVTAYGVGGQPHDESRLNESPDGGWRYAFKYELSVEYKHFSNPDDFCSQDAGENEYGLHIAKLMLTLPDGSRHPMRLDGGWEEAQGGGYSRILPDGRGACQSVTGTTGTLTYFSIDGTYLRLEIQHDSDTVWQNNPWTLYLPDGGRVTGGNAPQRIYDRNNNYIEIINTLSDQNYGGHDTVRINDQVGRSVVLEYNSAANQDTVHVRGTNNELVQWRILWGTIQVNKTYLPSYLNHTWPLQASLRVVTQITLPAQAGSNLTYGFAYNANTANPSYGWGEVNSVTLPSGAKASYQYLYDNVNLIDSKDVLKNYATRKDLVYRPEYDLTSPVSNAVCGAPGATGCVTETWTYLMTYQTGKPASCAITGPDGGVSTEYMNKTDSWAVPIGDGQAYKSVRADGTVVERYWQNNTARTSAPLFNEGSMFNPYVKYELTSIKDGQGNLSQTSIKEYSRDKNGNVTQVEEYDRVPYGNVQRTTGGHPDPAYAPWGATLKRVTSSVYNNPTPDASNSTTEDGDVYHRSTAPRTRGTIASTEAGNGTQTLSRTEFYYDNAATTGNPTQQKTWDSTKGVSSNPLITVNSVSTQYNSYGSPILSTDARGTQTQYAYGAVNGYADLYPTTTKIGYQTGVEQMTTAEYDYYTGAVTRVTDPNGAATATTYDAFGRPTLVKVAEGIAAKETHTATAYSDVNRRVIVRSDLTNAGDGKLVSVEHYDQLGRVRLSRRLEDSATESETSETAGVKVQMRYSYSGSHSYQIVSNPYRAQYSHQATSEPSMGWTRSKSDNGGRTIEAQTFNGATLPAPWGANTSSSGAVTTAYDAEFTTVTDQAGKARRSMMNGLGQLARVDEPDKVTGSLGSTAAPVQPTSYSYDALGNLTQVAQGTQTPRTFNYSSLSRLTSTTNPESGTVTYTYDAGGNLLTKTDARSVTITYGYDALSRNKTVDYSNTTVNPDIERYYDNPAADVYGRGRFWYDYKGGNYSAGSEVEHLAVDSYDALGRPLSQRQMFKASGVWSGAYTTGRTYTRAGAVETQMLPSGHTVSHTYDPPGRLQTFSGNLGDGVTRTYSTGATYDAAGRITREAFGTQIALYHKRHYNTRGQLYDVRLGSATDEWSFNRGAIIAYYDGAYSWSNSGNAATGADNNGNVRRAQVWVPGDDAVSAYALSDEYFDYDALNRLKSVNEYKEATGVARTHAFVQTYDYDRWGNRTINQAGTTQTLAPEMRKAFIVDTASNRLSVPSGQTGVMTYDLGGNLIHDSYTGKGNRVYDAENRMTSATIGINSVSVYAYDADGRRVRRSTPDGTVWQVYGFDGELLAEYAAGVVASTPQKEYGYRNGE
ncbi:MAG TPA: hypothetical protein VD835_11105, partial [Pyrinomonadaceae bacterium]|nr:hypothetical protein [Pyrinomonadaceae bacterium]